MAPFWVTALALALSPVGQVANLPSSLAACAEKPAATPPAGKELTAAVRAALRRWARPSNAQADQAAREFLALYQQLQEDTQIGPATRQELRQTVRTRLAHLADQIARRAAREKREEARAPVAQSVKTPADRADNMAQWGGAGPAGRGFARQGFGGMGLGGMGLPGSGAGPGQNADYGLQLVDLIERTIAPSTWEVNGGLGTIYYFRPLRALVVRQTDEVHGQIGDMIEQLHRAAR
jgi:hypothetical protein